jgi:hypothetical protein
MVLPLREFFFVYTGRITAGMSNVAGNISDIYCHHIIIFANMKKGVTMPVNGRREFWRKIR